MTLVPATTSLPPVSPLAGIAPSRVTIVTPTKRVDLALPSDLPLAHLLPNLLAAAGEAGRDPGGASSGWVLQRVGGPALDAGASLAALEVRDGEILYLLPRASELPEAVFDDVADTIATGIKERSGRWQPRHTRTAGLTAAVALLVAGAVALVLGGPPWTLPGAAAGVFALLAVAGGAALSRAAGDSGAGAAIGYAALPYAFLAGLFTPARPVGVLAFGAPNLLAACAVTAMVATVAGWAVADGLPNFFGVTLAAMVGAAGSASVMFLDASAAGAAAVAVGVVLACTPLIPTLSFRLARLPLPSMPANAEELRSDNQELDGPEVKRRAVVAERFATGLIAGIALVAVVAVVLLIGAPGWTSGASVLVVAVALLLRARVFNGIGQRVFLLGAGLIGLIVFAVSLAATGQIAALLTVLGLLWAVALAAGMGLYLPEHKPTPFWGRAGDVLDFVLIMAMFPLALGVLDVYAWVRGLSG
ncbi:type VII secretion integral membrane protein EccD [Streptosporangium sp. KLBMP 9127]|nr:type VII secretion integral membrane protein EccD [Streptosporangium sp. KLBMP 9127]